MSSLSTTASNQNKTIYLIRHGQSKGQTAKRHGIDRRRDQSLRDCGLSQKGKQQAAEIPNHFAARGISEESIELVISSPLTRALETAVLGFQHVSSSSSRSKQKTKKAPAPILVHYGLREVDSSLPENTPRASMEEVLQYIALENTGNLTGEIDTASLQPKHWPRDDIDNYSNHDTKERRLRKIFQWIAAERTETTIAVVSHFGVIRAAVGAQYDLRPKNAVPIQCRLYPNGTLQVCVE